MRHKIEVLDRHCADVGRDPTEVQRTAIVGADPLADTDAFLRQAEAYAALGIEQLWVSTQTDDPVRLPPGSARSCSPGSRRSGDPYDVEP